MPDPVDLATIAADQTRELPSAVAGEHGKDEVRQKAVVCGVGVGGEHLVEAIDEAVLDVVEPVGFLTDERRAPDRLHGAAAEHSSGGALARLSIRSEELGLRVQPVVP